MKAICLGCPGPTTIKKGCEPAADGNDVLLTGAGSSWSNALGLNLGLSGRANQVRVFAGGTVAMGGIGNLGHFTEAGSNRVVVADPGSRWLTASDLLVAIRHQPRSTSGLEHRHRFHPGRRDKPRDDAADRDQPLLSTRSALAFTTIACVIENPN